MVTRGLRVGRVVWLAEYAIGAVVVLGSLLVAGRRT
jgi:hypothetical protein